MWFGGGLTVGPKAEVDVSVGIAFWQGAASDIGWTPSLEVSNEALRSVMRGYSVPLDIGFTAYGGGSVTIYFGLGTAGKLHPTILGFGIAAAAGAGGGGSLGLVYTYAACPLRSD